MKNLTIFHKMVDTGVNPCMVGPQFFALTSLSRDLHFHGDEFLNIATSMILKFTR